MVTDTCCFALKIITSRDGSPEKPIQLLTAKTSRILLRDAPNSILGSEISSTKTSTAFLNANVTEAERNDLASLHTEDPHNTPDCPLRNGIQEANRFSTASQPQPSTATNTPFPPAVVPTSWADLLKDKGRSDIELKRKAWSVKVYYPSQMT